MSSEKLHISISCPPKKTTETGKNRKQKKTTVFDDNDVTEEDNTFNKENIQINDEDDNNIESNPSTKKKKKKKQKKKSSIQGMNINSFNIDDDEEEKNDEISKFKRQKSKSQVYGEYSENEENNNEEVTKKKKKKKKKIEKNNTEENLEEENVEEIKPKKKVKKKKKKLEESEENNKEENIEEENDEEIKPKKKTKKKKKKSEENEENNIEENIEEENDEDIKPKKKVKKKKKKSEEKEENNIEENIEEENYEQTKPKKKKKKKTIDEEEKNQNEDEENNLVDQEEEKPKKKKKKKKKNIEDEEENKIEENNEIENEEEIPKTKKKKKITKKNSDNNEEIMNEQNEEEIEEKKNEIKEENEDNKINTNNSSKKSLSNSIFIDTKKKLGHIFFTKKRKNKNNDYIETDGPSVTESTVKEKNVVEFLEKAKGIKYKGYNYIIKEEDYFERKGVIMRTILNSEDAAIKKCEEISNKIKDGDKWIDPDFGEQEKNSQKNKESLYGDGPIPAGNPRDTNIKWYPLSEISDYAQFFSDGVESNDVIQGCLGDCWFISALSVIATKDYLLRGEFSESILSDKKIDEEENVMLSTGIYPPIFHSFRKKGIFCFRFFKNFKWRYVLVDSRLPCLRVYNNQTPALLYGQCRARNEFWVPLIEKAYAKLHGSYRALVSGFIDDGLVDLTGLTSKKMVIETEKLKTRQKIDELWDILLKNSELYFSQNKQKSSEGKIISAKFYTRNKTMMGCSVEAKGNTVEMEVILHNRHTGILAGHAYSILDVFEIPKPRGTKRKTSRLLRIRNPWGRKEWNGKWSDDSVETKKNKERIEEKLNEKYKETNEKINLSQEDGTFLMCFSDFRQIFNKLFICKNFPPTFIGLRIFGKWTKNESGGLPVNSKQEKTFYSNPQIYLQRKVDGLVSVSLLQNDGRLVEPNFPYPQTINKVCLLIFRVNSKNKVSNLNNLIEKTLIVSRRDSILELNMAKGSYIIIPSTFDYGKTGDYCLEFHFEDELKNDEINGVNRIDCLKNSYIEKLGGESVNWEIISEFISSQAKSSTSNKEQFIIQKFKEIIKDEDDFEYSTGQKMGGFKNGNKDDDEDFDYI